MTVGLYEYSLRILFALIKAIFDVSTQNLPGRFSSSIHKLRVFLCLQFIKGFRRQLSYLLEEAFGIFG
jgi:hypothetical protein